MDAFPKSHLTAKVSNNEKLPQLILSFSDIILPCCNSSPSMASTNMDYAEPSDCHEYESRLAHHTVY